MQHPQPTTQRDRDRSLRRVRRLTVGAAVGSLAAVLGLGTVAAATNPGKTQGQSTSSQPATGTGSTATQTPTPTPTATPSQSTGDSGLQQAPSAPSGGASGGASATSGGS